MKSKRYSVEQIVAAVRQHELRGSAADTARKLGIAEQTFYRWKKQYGGLEPSEVRELKQLREENARTNTSASAEATSARARSSTRPRYSQPRTPCRSHASRNVMVAQ